MSDNRVIRTPPGLLGNGLNGYMLKLGLHEGGVSSYKERMKKYADFGLMAAMGRSNWGELAEKLCPPPHKDIRPLLDLENSEENTAAAPRQVQQPATAGVSGIERFRVAPQPEDHE